MRGSLSKEKVDRLAVKLLKELTKGIEINTPMSVVPPTDSLSQAPVPVAMALDAETSKVLGGLTEQVATLTKTVERLDEKVVNGLDTKVDPTVEKLIEKLMGQTQTTKTEEVVSPAPRPSIVVKTHNIEYDKDDKPIKVTTIEKPVE